MHRLYVNFARFYEEGGVAGQAETDLDSARKILEKATKVSFRAVEDLAEVWCEWSEMELRHEYVQNFFVGQISDLPMLATTTKLFGLCNVQLQFLETPRLVTTTMYV